MVWKGRGGGGGGGGSLEASDNHNVSNVEIHTSLHPDFDRSTST